jgi:predicted dehydrogenase
VIGDLGTHAQHLARYITGLEITEVSAELSTVVPGRQADDNGHMVAAGNLHGQRIRVFGEKGSLEWVQEQANDLILRPIDGPHQVLSRGMAYLAPEAKRAARLWPGHPEGFIDAFANLYTDIADAVLARRDGLEADPLALTFPTVEDGALGVKFIEAAVESNRQDGRWVDATLALE